MPRKGHSGRSTLQKDHSRHGSPGQVTAAQARAFRLLAVADSPDITLVAAAAVVDLPVADTALLLESLVDVHLLELGGVDRYHFHEPVRHFARGRAYVEDGAEACQAALTRLVRFYSVESGGVRARA